eukprot:TRINITY_DN1772_c0_g1_i1.p1 TRINITY_DN1772_c0_g1~~TRINITY_DN1772_c0_g1_i1.p1  ORF type:complete len:292 (+),score=121.64 TRINITY_DN1772_c0_g1_i1:33-878(+)
MDRNYLSNNVDDALALGIAETVMSQPLDPIKYLGEWLLAYDEKLQMSQKQRQEEKNYQQSLIDIQKDKEIDLQNLQNVLITEKQQLEQMKIDEEKRRKEKQVELQKYHEKLEEERIMKDPLLRNRRFLVNIREELGNLPASSLLDLKRSSDVETSVHKVIKGIFYVLGKRPSEMETWSEIRGHIAGSLFKTLKAFDPEERSKKPLYRRSKTVLDSFTEEEIEEINGNAIISVCYRFFKVAVELHEAVIGEKIKEALSDGFEAQDVDDEEDFDDDEEETVFV